MFTFYTLLHSHMYLRWPLQDVKIFLDHQEGFTASCKGTSDGSVNRKKHKQILWPRDQSIVPIIFSSTAGSVQPVFKQSTCMKVSESTMSKASLHVRTIVRNCAHQWTYMYHIHVSEGQYRESQCLHYCSGQETGLSSPTYIAPGLISWLRTHKNVERMAQIRTVTDQQRDAHN